MSEPGGGPGYRSQKVAKLVQFRRTRVTGSPISSIAEGGGGSVPTPGGGVRVGLASRSRRSDSGPTEARAERADRVQLADAQQQARADVDRAGSRQPEAERDELAEQATAEAVVEAVPDAERHAAREERRRSRCEPTTRRSRRSGSSRLAAGGERRASRYPRCSRARSQAGCPRCRAARRRGRGRGSRTGSRARRGSGSSSTGG